MLKQLNISNFQSHKDTSLDFHQGVNIIVGQSDSGKSAIIKALKWLVWNRPLGDDFRSTWGGKTSVEVFTDDAHVVRSKDNENEYILGDTHFKAFSTDVPQEITAALNLSELNLQNQLDAHFLLSLSPGEVASFFNRVAKLETIDKATSNVNSAIRELTADIKYKEKEEQSKVESLKEFENIEEFEKEVEYWEEEERFVEKYKINYKSLATAVEKYHAVKDKLKEYEPLLVLEEKVNDVLALYEKKKVLEASHDKLYSLIHDWYYNKSQREHLEQTLALEKIVNDILLLMERREVVTGSQKKLSVTLSSLRGIQDRIKNGVAYVAQQESLFKKEMGDVCILCNQKIKHNEGI